MTKLAWLWGAVIVGVLAGAAASCAGDPYDPNGSGGAGAGGTSTASAGPGGTGGQGGIIVCTSNSECVNLPVTICHAAVCEAGACVVKPTGTTEDQKKDSVGDCKRYVCDPNGNLIEQNDPTDPPRDANSCTVEKCGAASTPGTTCTMPNGANGICDPKNIGKCINCNDMKLCEATQTCVNGACQPLTCADSMVDSGETGVDCGGPCPPCALTVSCSKDADCGSRNCTNGKCDIPSCTNGKMDGQESDTDCGGPQCEACTPDHQCRADEDCSSKKCHDGKCEPLTCYDNQKNNDEAGVDCGGSCPYDCP